MSFDITVDETMLSNTDNCLKRQRLDHISSWFGSLYLNLSGNFGKPQEPPLADRTTGRSRRRVLLGSFSFLRSSLYGKASCAGCQALFHSFLLIRLID